MALIGVSSPLRLLRETWRNPTMLAQELYAMFTSREPITTNTPVEIRVPKGETGLTITQTDRAASESANAMAAGRARPPVAAIAAVQFERAASRAFDPLANRTPFAPEPASRASSGPVSFAGRAAAAPYEAPAFRVNGEVAFVSSSPVQFSAPPVVFDAAAQSFVPLIPPQIDADSAPEVAFGIVTGGEGKTWTVQIIDSTVPGNVGEEVAVRVLGVRDGETPPEGATIGPITAVDLGDADPTYIACPPVWLA